MSLTETVATNLHAARLKRRMSQGEVAERAGISVSYISMLERGERMPPLETVEALAAALGVPPLDLLRSRKRSRGRR